MNEPIYHRKESPEKIVEIRKSGEIWGGPIRPLFGGGDPCVKAFLGPLPSNWIAIEFTTETPPSRERMFANKPGVVWVEGSPGVEPVDGESHMVKIRIRLVEQ